MHNWIKPGDQGRRGLSLGIESMVKFFQLESVGTPGTKSEFCFKI
jgi:hypothetical protein